MPFTVHELRYRPEQSYPVLYSYLQRHAQQALGSLKYDANELDIVVGHVIERLVQFGVLGGGDHTPLTAFDRMSNAQFYAFLNRSIKNKAIDRLRKRRLAVSTIAEIEASEETEGENNPLNEAVESIWGNPPFATPEETAIAIASQLELRNLLKHCIKELSAAPHQLQAVILEMEEVGATALLQTVIDELKAIVPSTDTPIPHASQHKDHAHRKLRHCLQQQSSNLTVVMAFRLTEYGVRSTDSEMFEVDIPTLAQTDLSESEVRTGLKGLVAEGLLDWNDEQVVRLSSNQVKHLARFYREE